MRDLNFKLVSRFCNTIELDIANVLWLQDQEAAILEEDSDDVVLLKKAALINLSRNKLSGLRLHYLWQMFPSAWWIDLSRNQICDLSSVLPLAFGFLNLIGNDIQEKDLSFISKSYILRLSLSIDFKTSDITSRNRALVQFVATHLPNVWVINDDYILSRYKSTVTNDSQFSEKSLNSQEFWLTRPTTIREQNLLCAIQEIPLYDAIADQFKLDILLEDYFQEAFLLNKFTEALARSNLTAIKTTYMQNLTPNLTSGRSLPTIDLYPLLLIPHRLRLDLSVLLTASILYPIPFPVLNDTFMILFSRYLSLADIQCLSQLPLFARTAIVCIIRRICRRELDELNGNGFIFPKPSRAEFESINDINFDSSSLTYMGVNGFHFLRPIKWYLLRPLDANLAGLTKPLNSGDHIQSFSEIEMEILENLPDTPTLSSSADMDEPSGTFSDSFVPHYKRWSAYVARHTVLLLTKSPQCPPLTRAQTSKINQDIYSEMIPLLKAAQMTLEDLDVELSGPGNDGRVLRKGAGKVIPFGMGLPNAGPSSLVWNTQDMDRFRGYEKPWNNSEKVEQSQSVFITEPKSRSPRKDGRRGNEQEQVEMESMRRPLSPSFILATSITSRPSTRGLTEQNYLELQLHQQELTKLQLTQGLQQYGIEQNRMSFSVTTASSPVMTPQARLSPTTSPSLKGQPGSEAIFPVEIIQPNASFLLPSSSIHGYSADAVFEPTFLLASPSTIHKQNSFLAQSGSVIRWDSIEHPPVVLSLPTLEQPTTVAAVVPNIEQQRSSLEEHAKSLTTDSILTIALDVADENQSNSKNSVQSVSTPGTAKGSVHISVSVPKHFDDDVSDAASTTGSMHSNANLNAVAFPSNELSFLDHSRINDLNELSMKLHSMSLKSQSDKQSPMNSEIRGAKSNFSNAGTDLLIEMGTIKNIRQLSYQNILDKIDRSRRRKAKVESDTTTTVKDSPVLEKSEESSFYLTALASATSQPKTTKSTKQPNKKRAVTESEDIPGSKISGRSSDLRSEAFDEVEDEEDDEDNYDEDEDDDNNGYDDDDYYEDEDDDDGNEKLRSFRGLDTSEWRDMTVTNTTDSLKVDSGEMNEPMKGFQESSLTAEVSNTLTDTRSSAPVRDVERAQTISLIETIRRTSNYDNVFTLNQDVEVGARSVHGKQISPTWYPCQKKVVYRLAIQNSIPTKPRLDPLYIPTQGSTRSRGKQSAAQKKSSSSQHGVELHPFDESSVESAGDEAKDKYSSDEGVAATVDVKDLKKDKFFQSLLQPSRQSSSNTLTFIPLPQQYSKRDDNRSRLIKKRFRMMNMSNSASSFSSAYRQSGLITGSGMEFSSPLSLVSHNLNPSGELVSNSSTTQILNITTAGPPPPEPSLRTPLKPSQSVVSGDSHTFSDPPPAVITHSIPTHMLGASSTVHREEEDIVNLSPRLPTMRESVSHPNPAQQGMRSLSPTEMQHQRRESNGATSSASLLIKPSPLNRVVQNPISIHDIEKPGSAQLMSFYSAANSPMLGSRNYPLTPLRPPSPPFRNMKGFVLQAKPTNNQSLEPYRKHKAATHKLQLNTGFKYTKKMNLSTDSLYS